MTIERELPTLLRTLSPARRPGRFVFVTTPSLPTEVRPVATVREDEGLTLVLPRSDAERLGLPAGDTYAMITLEVRSALDAVGLTAAVAGALASHGIACNVVAGVHHDHLFVPEHRADDALTVLRALADDAGAGFGQ
jgi:uncharacterized protein